MSDTFFSKGRLAKKLFQERAHAPQYQTTFSTPALLNSRYSCGIVGCRLCAGRFIDPRIVPPWKGQKCG